LLVINELIIVVGVHPTKVMIRLQVIAIDVLQ